MVCFLKNILKTNILDISAFFIIWIEDFQNIRIRVYHIFSQFIITYIYIYIYDIYAYFISCFLNLTLYCLIIFFQTEIIL